jgi:Cu(I)/Ag(I) efflux system membrane fusion protein
MDQKLLTVGLVGVIALGLIGAEGGDAPEWGISLHLQQMQGLQVAEVTRGRLNPGITASATVVFDEREVATVQAAATGILERLQLRAAPVTVRQGDTLADLYVPTWFAPQMEYLAVKNVRCPGTAHLAKDAGQRLRRLGMPEDLIHALERTGTPQSRLTLKAPISGVLTDLTAHEGMRVTCGSTLFRINGLSTVWVNAEVPESLGKELCTGDAVKAQTTSLPGAVFSGTVASVLPSVNLASRSTIAGVALANPTTQLLPGMLVTLQLAPIGGSDVLLVPNEAVIAAGSRRVVTVVENDGRFRPVSVETGLQSSGVTEIRSGLTLGQKVILFEYLNQVPSRLLSRQGHGTSGA